MRTGRGSAPLIKRLKEIEEVEDVDDAVTVDVWIAELATGRRQLVAGAEIVDEIEEIEHAAQLREKGVDVGIISRQLGHRSRLTTIRYLDHIQPTAVVDAMRGRVWLV